MYLKLNVIGSASSGNSTFIWDSKTLILIDCGFSRKYINESIRKLNLREKNPAAVLITHGHGDHINDAALRDLLKKGASVYCSGYISAELLERYSSIREAKKIGRLKIIKPGRFSVAGFNVEAFNVPHDSGCLGFNVFKDLKSGEKKVTVATDIAHTAGGISEYFVDSDIIVIESNYDDAMLQRSSRPMWLKNRISQNGHLSNRECHDFIISVIKNSKRSPSSVILAHISAECNSADKALRDLQLHVEKNKQETEVFAALRRRLIDTVHIK
ncbi:MAG: MBL fold metallo-hydrolase [Elusimicrobia bacterium]|jgi:phosphoribosyl 1,2-cyclic phosphodiesterase|nr:MBL fold metallo-hydrolase [Elusimicrobiota bacterium]